MTLKNDWVNGDIFTPTAANDMANAVNGLNAITAAASGSAPNILVDGGYEKNSTWWAAEISPAKSAVTLSSTRAATGSQSLKITGPATHYPNVTSSGVAGTDSTYSLVRGDMGGRVYRISFKVWRQAGNTSSGYIRAQLSMKGASSTDVIGGIGPTNVVNQSDITAGQWYEYSNFFVIPESGTNYPYQGFFPYIAVVSVGSSDVFYVDSVRLEDVTSIPWEVTAPPPTGDRTTDTARVQKLVDFAQSYGATVRLRQGTYPIDIVTTKTYRQPRIIGAGKQLTFWDGTLKVQGTSSKFSGGWISDFQFSGSHAGSAALELNGVCDFHWDRIYVYGTYDVGIWFRNELAGDYTEVCNGTMDFYQTVTNALKYTVNAGDASFHGSGLTGDSKIQQCTTNYAVLIESLARPYNAPFTAKVWQQNTSYSIFRHLGSTTSNFYGNLTVEGTTGAKLATGNKLYYAGTLNAYLGSATSPDYQTFILTSSVTSTSGVATPSLGTLAIGAINGLGGNGIIRTSDVGSANALTIQNSATGAAPQIFPYGADTDIGLSLRTKNAGVVDINGSAVAVSSNVQTFTSSGTWTKPAGAVSVHVRVIGPGSGGGAGARGPSGTALAGGGGGGSGGMSELTFVASDLTSTVAVTVGTGGAGATGQTTDSTAGANGSPGTSATTFGSFLQAGRSSTGGTGGGLAAGGTAGTAGSGMFAGGAGGAGSITGAAGAAGGFVTGPTAGGAGGGITTAPAANAGGTGGTSNTNSLATGTAGSGANGGNGTSSTVKGGGTGGGGGGASTTVAGYNGGNGGNYGAGGGGGGASLNGSTSGAGGNGGDGICIVTTYF